MITAPDILRGLRDLGVRTGDLLAVHSSLGSIGYVDGGAEAVIRALEEAVGTVGTLLVPTFNGPAAEFSAAHQACGTGIIPETFRTKPRSRRSLHPTHSVAARGPLARRLVRDHHLTEPLGVSSPFHRAALLRGKVLMIGIGFTRCSIIHVAESLSAAPYQGIFYPGYDCESLLVSANGRLIPYRPRENPGDSAGFTVVEELMRERGMLSEGTIGSALVILADAGRIVGTALEVLAESGDALLCTDLSCPVCPARREIILSTGWRYSGAPGIPMATDDLYGKMSQTTRGGA